MLALRASFRLSSAQASINRLTGICRCRTGRLYGLSPTTLRHQIGRGVLKGKKFGRNWMVRNDHIADYVRERSRKAVKSKEGTHEIRQGGSEGKPLSENGFGTALHEIFKSVGGVDLEMPERDAMREPPSVR